MTTSPPLGKQVGGDHYKDMGLQPIEVIRAWGLGFELGNVVKYIARHGRKGRPVEDIEKAIHYLELYKETLSPPHEVELKGFFNVGTSMGG